MIEAMNADEKAQLSTDWLALLQGATATDPWIHGFSLVHRDGAVVVGTAGFKGPPGADGVVEIAYGVVPEHQGKGFATEAARALVAYAFSTTGLLVLATRESQRDSDPKPRVARHELPWVNLRKTFPTATRLRPIPVHPSARHAPSSATALRL